MKFKKEKSKHCGLCFTTNNPENGEYKITVISKNKNVDDYVAFLCAKCFISKLYCNTTLNNFNIENRYNLCA